MRISAPKLNNRFVKKVVKIKKKLIRFTLSVTPKKKSKVTPKKNI